MTIDDAKTIIFKATADGQYVEQCIYKSFVRIGGENKIDRVFFDALDSLHKEGALVRVPSAGQSRSTLAFRRADKRGDAVQVK